MRPSHVSDACFQEWASRDFVSSIGERGLCECQIQRRDDSSLGGGHDSVVAALLAKKAASDAVSGEGLNALDMAKQGSHDKIVCLLALISEDM